MFVSCLENDHPGNAASGLKCENVVRAGFVCLVQVTVRYCAANIFMVS